MNDEKRKVVQAAVFLRDYCNEHYGKRHCEDNITGCDCPLDSGKCNCDVVDYIPGTWEIEAELAGQEEPKSKKADKEFEKIKRKLELMKSNRDFIKEMLKRIDEDLSELRDSLSGTDQAADIDLTCKKVNDLTIFLELEQQTI